MQRTRNEVTQDSVTRNTELAKDWGEETVVKALQWATDPQKKERLGKSLCRTCFYLHNRRIGGAAMTSQPCGVCAVSVTYCSTATDDLCLDCALKHELCKQCGADVQLRPRRVFEPEK